MLCIISAEVLQQPPPCEINTFSNKACTVIEYQVLLYGRVQNFIAEGVFYYSVLNLLARDMPYFPRSWSIKLVVGKNS